MKHIKTYIIFTFAALVIGSIGCQSFEDINENPNEPTTVTPDVVLNASIVKSVNTSTNQAFLLSNNIAQLTAKTLRTEVDDYTWNAFPTVWEGFYEAITDAQLAEEQALEFQNDAMQAAAITMRCWIFSNLTNAYGDVPYFEAIEGAEDNFTPAYTPQEEIYEDLLLELERANELFSSGEGTLTGEILFNGNAETWQRFCNSLRMRLLLTASNQIDDVASQFNTIYSEELFINSNQHNAILDYVSDFPNQFPLIPIKRGDFDAVAMSSTAISVMQSYNDPRLMRYARPNNEEFNENATFSGADNGRAVDGCSKGGSRLGVSYYNYPDLTAASDVGLPIADGIILSYAEMEFILAEAAAKGWINTDIEQHYKAGIQASMDYYMVNYNDFGYSDFEDYYTDSGVAYSSVTDIWEQKWLSLFFHGLEPYFELRRWYFEASGWEGLPFIDAPCNEVNNGELPVRFLYPGEEQSLNFNNYQDAIERLGGADGINVPIWLVQ